VAQETVVTLDPASAQIGFTLGATLHTVHGNFKLKSGEIRFDPATGKAGGSIVVDATSGDTDNSSRDKKMHAEILESAKFPEISFTPTGVKGPLKEISSGPATAHVDVAGVFHVHGQDHDGSAAVAVDRGINGLMRITATFAVPYVKWGVKDPSTTFLHVKDTVDVEVQATAHIGPANGPLPIR
jgi:polyisoprenoid-binding protein YceI